MNRTPSPQEVRQALPAVLTFLEADRHLSEPVDESGAVFSDKETDRVASIVRDELKGKPNEEFVVKIAKRVLTNFAKAVWTRRSFWQQGLDAKTESLAESDIWGGWKRGQYGKGFVANNEVYVWPFDINAHWPTHITMAQEQGIDFYHDVQLRFDIARNGGVDFYPMSDDSDMDENDRLEELVLASNPAFRVVESGTRASALLDLLIERDDIGKLPGLNRDMRRYARLHGGIKALKGKQKLYMKVNAELTNPGKPDRWNNFDVAGKVKQAKK